MDDERNNKDIEIVQGIGNLDISPVYENTTSAKPKMQDEKPKNIVIPQVKKHIEENDNLDEEESIHENEDVEEVPEEISEEIEDIDTNISEDDTSDNDPANVSEDDDVFESQIQFDDLNTNENNNNK